MHSKFLLLSVLLLVLTVACPSDSDSITLSGEKMVWHRLTFQIEGPQISELDSVNPFLNYRLQMRFQKGDQSYWVPGFYAADGNAAETSANAGNIWQVHFVPDQIGEWQYEVSFRQGENIALSDQPEAGTPLNPDGQKGKFHIQASNKTGSDFRAKGKIRYTGEHYLHHAGSGELFLKAGADSPENFLGYREFDNTYYGGDGTQREGEAKSNEKLHSFTPHIPDWQEGDPTWQGGKGKGMIGGVNYLASKGINSVYMLTNNVGGDGKDVFPWIEYESDFTRFDVSKLAQWEIVFSHMDQLGIMCHFVTQETENELMLDGGDLGLTRKLYYRELVARFAHHLGITWNLGEENGVAPWIGEGQNDQQRRDMATYLKEIDPYDNLLVLHTLPNQDLRDSILTYMLEVSALDGPSLQTHPEVVHRETLHWRKRSAENGKKWVVCSDEIGPADTGAKPDADDPEHNEIRHQVLWGNLMAGGGGVEWYFGYKYAHNDLGYEDWRSRENLWEQTVIARDFFLSLPLLSMNPADERLLESGPYAIEGEGLVVVYLPEGGEASLKDMPAGSYRIEWFNPRKGGALQAGKTVNLASDGRLDTGNPPAESGKDWVAIIRTN